MAAVFGSEGPDPILLVGAGVSASSGVPLMREMVMRIAHWAYCRASRRSLTDPSVRRSDWLPALERQTWYQDPGDPVTYAHALEKLLPTLVDRQQFLAEVSAPRVGVGKSYVAVVRLMASRRLRTVLTTNFDDLLVNHAATVPNPRRIVAVRQPIDHRSISTAAVLPQVVYLHGDVAAYAERYVDGGATSLASPLRERLLPLLRDHPIVVVGYDGREPAIVRHLLLDQMDQADGFPHGIYWCRLRGSTSNQLPEPLSELSRTLGARFRLVQINDADTTLSLLADAAESHGPASTTAGVLPTGAPVSFDMRASRDVLLDALDWREFRHRFSRYADELRIATPAVITSDWLQSTAADQQIFVRVEDRLTPTNAAVLLFAPRASEHIRSARIVVNVSGEQSQVIEGHLWTQVDLIEALDHEFNAPFRLKGPISETVTPYDRVALKEAIVNAIAHREYDVLDAEPITIQVAHDRIVVRSPGGLHEAALLQVPLGSNVDEALGTVPIRAYRNPIIADFLYTWGAMDKAGSGLIDIRRRMRQNGGDAIFRTEKSGRYFEVTLLRRPERPEHSTGAAVGVTPVAEFVSNAFEVVTLPTHVWAMDTKLRHFGDIPRGEHASLPALIFRDGKLFTFSDLSFEENPLRRFGDPNSAVAIPTESLEATPDGERRVSQLLYEALAKTAKLRGLVFDYRRKRAYFHRTDDGERSVAYRARIRAATRTVVKARVSSATNRVSYWEHQAVDCRFRRYGSAWALHLVPTYVFTMDGWNKFLPQERSGRLATSRLSREYNSQVDAHVVFWAAVLSEGEPEITLDLAPAPHTIVRAGAARCILNVVDKEPDEEAVPQDEPETEAWVGPEDSEGDDAVD